MDAESGRGSILKLRFLRHVAVLDRADAMLGPEHFAHFNKQRNSLSRLFVRSLEIESKLVSAASFSSFERHLNQLKRMLANEIATCNLRTPHLFSTIYAGTYFGIRQAIEADSIVAAIQIAKANKLISRDEHRWCTIALGRSLLKISNSTGHFAQYLKEVVLVSGTVWRLG